MEEGVKCWFDFILKQKETACANQRARPTLFIAGVTGVGFAYYEFSNDLFISIVALLLGSMVLIQNIKVAIQDFQIVRRYTDILKMICNGELTTASQVQKEYDKIYDEVKPKVDRNYGIIPSKEDMMKKRAG